ncbi:hypothetical protein B0T20DRAFT_276372 [Sordaria brevicollis]|uniref:Secreted protein n=1 Tax=Sordaria brevicollis TaxID=83679 RepID=A0AAE0UAP1_SORBR|nr:hypothetical protein B0T20DRAFT_276372 [Sordaria brevicollis]
MLAALISVFVHHLTSLPLGILHPITSYPYHHSLSPSCHFLNRHCIQSPWNPDRRCLSRIHWYLCWLSSNCRRLSYQRLSQQNHQAMIAWACRNSQHRAFLSLCHR